MSKEPKYKYVQTEGGTFVPRLQMKQKSELPPGVYTLGMDMNGNLLINPMEMVTDGVVDIPNSVAEEIKVDIQKFFSEGVTQKFKDYGLVHKRGALFYGKAGTGKTIILAETARTAIKSGAVVFFNAEPGLLVQALPMIKAVEPDKKIVVMYEEFDGFLNHDEATLLSLLDGEIQVPNVYYLAATNYINRIPARLKNRPSRFAMVIEVKEPDASARRTYLNAKLVESDKHMLESLVEQTDGFVIDQIKDIIISVCVFGVQPAEAINKVKEMQAEGSTSYTDYQESQATDIFKTMQKQLRKEMDKMIRVSKAQDAGVIPGPFSTGK